MPFFNWKALFGVDLENGFGGQCQVYSSQTPNGNFIIKSISAGFGKGIELAQSAAIISIDLFDDIRTLGPVTTGVVSGFQAGYTQQMFICRVPRGEAADPVILRVSFRIDGMDDGSGAVTISTPYTHGTPTPPGMVFPGSVDVIDNGVHLLTPGKIIPDPAMQFYLNIFPDWSEVTPWSVAMGPRTVTGWLFLTL
jgi:hypothetical protein